METHPRLLESCVISQMCYTSIKSINLCPKDRDEGSGRPFHRSRDLYVGQDEPTDVQQPLADDATQSAVQYIASKKLRFHFCGNISGRPVRWKVPQRCRHRSVRWWRRMGLVCFCGYSLQRFGHFEREGKLELFLNMVLHLRNIWLFTGFIHSKSPH